PRTWAAEILWFSRAVSAAGATAADAARCRRDRGRRRRPHHVRTVHAARGVHRRGRNGGRLFHWSLSTRILAGREHGGSRDPLLFHFPLPGRGGRWCVERGWRADQRA